ncbi:unnamed protein product [Didymodactylos carnosus]|uniref:CARD domain-containing protein n=1 Tax=Didymodactylos carnosus TaxID=1234261 RepID=A0A813QJM5_9BILA|nr:unnamed protein product [Didymodactylos carnosus]CAF3551038.1 unnamed protein product [Didymodactylos carnosus]
MVNLKKRDLIEQYRNLLENNLVLTDQFLKWFKDKRVLPDFVFDEIKSTTSLSERNKKFLPSLIENADLAFNRFSEALIANGQPFLGEFLEAEEKKAGDMMDTTGEIVIDDDFLRKCPGVDKLKVETREKLKIYLQEQLLKAFLKETWRPQNQGKSVELINLKRQHYEAQQKLIETIEEEKRNVIVFKDALKSEQFARQRKEEEMRELRGEVDRLKSDFEQKWSSQIRMVDANNRSVFKMHDKMIMLTDWLRQLDKMLKTTILQSGLDGDTMDQMQNKLKRYTTEIESLRGRGIGTDKLKDELYDSLYTSRKLPLQDNKNKPFYDLLARLFGTDQVTELSAICSKDVLQPKIEQDNLNEIKWRDLKIDELDRMNKDLRAELERIKSSANSIEDTNKSVKKKEWKPPVLVVTPRDPSKQRNRETLKPSRVEFGTKPGNT